MEIKFNHEGIDLYKSFSLTKEQGDKLDSIIFFESIVADSIIEKDYNGKSEQAPRVLKTKTGVLSRCMEHVKDDQEAAYLLFVFMGKHEMIHRMLAMYSVLNEKMVGDSEEKSEVIRRAYEHFKDRMSMEEVKEKFSEMMAQATRPFKPLKKLLRQVENSNYNFSLFKAMIDDDDNPDGYISEVIADSVHSLKLLKKSGLFSSSSFDDDEDED